MAYGPSCRPTNEAFRAEHPVVDGRGAHESGGRRLSLEHRLDLTSERVIARACFGEERGTPRRVARDCGVIDALDVQPALRRHGGVNRH